jgi:YesN/AraC family two-component response regulator
LLVTDIVMPKMNGKELARHLGRLSPRTKVREVLDLPNAN